MTSALLIDDLDTTDRSDLDLDIRLKDTGTGPDEGRTSWPPNFTDIACSCFNTLTC